MIYIHIYEYILIIGGDNIDTSIASLGILSAVQGKDLWTYVQGMPHLFSVGGLLYNQVKRDLGLVDGKHCQLQALPGKVCITL
jgi:deubiquitinating protein VCIP135